MNTRAAIIASCILVIITNISLNKSCPQYCVCINSTVSCTAHDVYFPPENVSVTTKHLILDFDSLATIPDEYFWKLRDLETINIASGRLPYLHGNVFKGLTKLLDVTVIKNTLRGLHKNTFTGLVNLRKINVSNNSILIMIPGVFDSQRKLCSLDISNNVLFAIKYTFGGLYDLQYLSLRKNGLSDIESHEFRDLHNLTYLDLSKNQISSIHDAAFDYMSKLEFLHLQGNSLQLISSTTFRYLFSLKTLNLHSNMITEILDLGFSHLTNLSSLNLSENKLNSIKARLFKNLTQLELMDMSGNNISVFYNDMQDKKLYLPKLITLKLNKNSISRFDVTLLQSSIDLQVLDLSSNTLTAFDMEGFAKLSPGTKRLYLQANPIMCDCKIINAMKRLKNGTLQVYGHCAEPSTLRYESLSGISNKNPCLNGQCSDRNTCLCKPSYNGKYCQFNVPDSSYKLIIISIVIVVLMIAILFLIRRRLRCKVGFLFFYFFYNRI